RDVEKLDRQDDRAAARLFSADTLAYIICYTHNNMGLFVYLYVFGEMIDRFESRTATHFERLKMILRAYFFKIIWKKFLNEAGYDLKQHFISPAADDILDTITTGYIGGVIIHRDHLEDKFPYLPWTHGTAGNEHSFGFLQKEMPDFTVGDLIHLIPKVSVRLQRACSTRLQEKSEADFQQQAAGYSHTYFDSSSANLLSLAQFPSDADISHIASVAYEEALSLWELLGYFP
ncbi:hypothetical protein BDQ17DRAFT_1217494, partial [Cyathus striatus]